MSKVLKAQQTSLNQQSYFVRVEPIRQPDTAPPDDPETDEIRSQAVQEAEMIRAQAYQEAAQIIQNAQADAAQIMETERIRVQTIMEAEVEAAKQLGYQDGYEHATQVVESEYAGRFAEVEQLYHLSVEDRKRYLAEAEPMIVDLACAVANKIMHRETDAPREWILDVVRAALDEINDAGKIEVRVHPEDFELVQHNREGLRKEVPGQTDLLVIPDRGVAAGGCVVNTAFGNIDARIDTQLEEVRKALQEVAAGLSHEPTTEV